ncbi:MAG: SpoIIE family protein phosphatase [Candidatus Zhuqueibacterota bacterium]
MYALKAAIKEEIKVPAHIDYLGELRNFVTKTGRKHSFPDTVVNAFKLCIDEAATNIIKHAYRDHDGMITMRVIVKKNSMTVVLVDQGKYFDPSRVADPDLKRYIDIGKKGGLGIFIMRKLLDEIEYHHTEEGNELRLTKYRDSSFRKKKEIQAPSLAVSLKMRYSIISAVILFVAIAIGYFFYFFKHGNQVLDEFVAIESPYCQNIARAIIDDNDEDLKRFYVALKVNEFKESRSDIFRISVTDTTNYIIHSTDEVLSGQEFKIPADHSKPRPNLYQYKTSKGIEVYSFKSNVNNTADQKVGNIYLEFQTDLVSRKVAAVRIRDLLTAIMILLLSYMGVAVLIYLIMNPFRKLSTWVRELGHGGDVKDEIDFDSGDEVGEIAKAFSDITDKFRQSQKNLAEQERIQKEMQLAQDIQQTLLPSETPVLEGYEIASHYESAKEVGGDYFDFIEVDKDTLGIVVADVSGKGVPGSLIMTMIRTALRTEARSIRSASEVLARVNEFVVNDMKKGMFVTLFYVIIDSKKRRINYASAGHNPMILYRQGSKKTYYLNPRGFPVGISLPDTELFKRSIESDTIQLAEDDILIIYTDGITEAMNGRREMFSEERLQDVIRKSGHLRANAFIDKLRDEIHSFTEGYEQSDDITVVAIKEQSTPEKIELNRAQNAHKAILAGKNIREACEESGITTYAYYNKYKKIFEEEGIDAYSIDETISVEAKHLSIEEKTKIYDIIKKHPEFGAKRISEELNIELYGFTEINESRIYDELVRSRLNTRQLREAYISRSGKKKRLKPPGTPMLTLDGKIILNRNYEEPSAPTQQEVPKRVQSEEKKEPSADQVQKVRKVKQVRVPRDPDDNFYLESLMTMPIEDLLKKERDMEEVEESDTGLQASAFTEKKGGVATESKMREESAEETHNDLFFDDEKSEESSDDIDVDFDDETVEYQRKEPAQHDDEGLEHDFSFKDIWDEQGDEIEEQSLDSGDTKRPAEQGADSDLSPDKIELPEMSIEDNRVSRRGIDIEDLLEEPDDAKAPDELGFETLIEEASFKNDIFQVEHTEENGNGKLELNEHTSGAEDDALHELEAPSFLNEIEEISMADEDDILSETEIASDDFSFNDLLDAIESDISFFEKGEAHEDEAELVLEGKPKNAEAKRASEEKDFGDFVDHVAVKNTEDVRPFPTKQDPLREKHLILGLKFYNERNYTQAVEQFLQVTKMYPDFKEAFSILGNSYYRSNQYEHAVTAYKRVKELDPNDTDAYENTGVIYANNGKFREAIREWKRLIEIDPGREDILNHITKAEELMKKL